MPTPKKKPSGPVTFDGGSKRSGVMPHYHCIPSAGVRRIAQRFSLGSATYGEGNWKKSLEEEATAAGFANDIFNHMQEHTMKMLEGSDPEDDHLGAIGWGITVLAYIEAKYDKPWTELER